MTDFTIIADQTGERVDALVARVLPDLTRSSAQRLLDQGQVTCKGIALKKNDKPKVGAEIVVCLPEPENVDIVAQDIPLDVIYEDDDVIVINKPVGLVVHPAPGHADGTLVNALLFHCGDSLSGINGERRPGIVHRIDRDTSGLIIAAKNDKAHVALAAQLQDHSLSRGYEAIVHGNFREDTGTVDAPIGRNSIDRKKMSIDRRNGRNAITHWTVIDRYVGFTHIACQLETGRTHQIRVHMASLAHPLLGDIVYGNKKPVNGLVGQCLHARRLKFVHPTTGKLVELESPLPEYFVEALRKVSIRR